MKRKSITIQEIAKMAGVHPSSVSRIINNRKGVSEETHKRVKKIIDALGYYPNERAQNLRKSQAGAIAIVTTKSSGYFFSKHFFHRFLEGVATSLRQNNIALILDVNVDDSFLKIFHQNRVDGIIVISIKENDKRILELINSGYPFVFVGRYGMYDVPSVISDNEGGAKVLTEHLIRLGHREIGFIGGPLNYPPYRERFEGFRKALYNNNLPINKEWIIELNEHENIPSDLSKKIKDFLKKKNYPRALFVFEDTAAAIVIREAQNIGIEVPRKLAVVGYDDTPLSSFINPPLTTVRQPMLKIGTESSKMLLKLISNEILNPQKLILPNELVIRKSCGSLISY